MCKNVSFRQINVILEHNPGSDQVSLINIFAAVNCCILTFFPGIRFVPRSGQKSALNAVKKKQKHIGNILAILG